MPICPIPGRCCKVGYEIPLNRHFYRCEPPRPLLEVIEAETKCLGEEA